MLEDYAKRNGYGIISFMGTLPEKYVEQSNEVKNSIISACKKLLPDYMVPVVIEFRKDLPRTPRGKVDYRALEKEAM